MDIKAPEVYQIGNPWQKKVYSSMAAYLESFQEVKSYGVSRNGNVYKHLLTTDQSRLNFINDEIYVATNERFAKHKAGDLNRILTNTAASQPYCFNLIVYLQQHLYLADKLFSDLIGKQISIKHLEPEFTPNKCNNIVNFERTEDESLGDQNPKLEIGTDADIAVFYTFEDNKKGVLLIEFKFIESEFSVCSSYSNKKDIQSTCDSGNFYKEFIEIKNSLCGYNRYKNWELTEKSKVFNNAKIKTLSACPFRFGLNQLWRNMLLSEKVASSRKCDEFGFWVFSPIQNDKYLWKNNETESQFRSILTDQGNTHFKKVHLETLFDKLREIISKNTDKEWLDAMEKKYRIE
jgi:hypothetical protein